MSNTEIKIEQVREVVFAKTIAHLRLADIPFEIKKEGQYTLIIVHINEGSLNG